MKTLKQQLQEKAFPEPLMKLSVNDIIIIVNDWLEQKRQTFKGTDILYTFYGKQAIDELLEELEK